MSTHSLSALVALFLLVLSSSQISSSEKRIKETIPIAEERALFLDPPLDQLAVESGYGYHTVIAAKPPPPPQPIPVPLPLPGHPGSIVLPSLPHHPKHGGGPTYRKSSKSRQDVPFFNGPKSPLTRSSNPTPVGSGTEVQTVYHPPPPPQLPPQIYDPPSLPKAAAQVYEQPPSQNYAPSPHSGGSREQLNYVDPRQHQAHFIDQSVNHGKQSNEQQYAPPPPQKSYSELQNDGRPSFLHQSPNDHGLNEDYTPQQNAGLSSSFLNPKANDQFLSDNTVSHDEHDNYNPPQASFLNDPGPQNGGNFGSNQYQQPQPHFGLEQNDHRDSIFGGSAHIAPVHSTHDDPWPPINNADMPQIVNINVKCEKDSMRVTIDFDRPFYGIIFSKGHYSNANCVHLPAGLGQKSANFDIAIGYCGTIGNTENGLYGYGQQSGSGTFFENTLIVQYDPQVQEVWDQARKLRCTWHDQYEKSVTFRPFPVDMLNVVRADFAGDNVGCWLQIQEGKGPWASEVSGLVKIGQTMTMVLAIKDDDNKFDMLVRNCMAHDGKRAPIQLVDQRGCVTRPKLMSKFVKIKNFGASASVLSYAYFQAFKFPDSMEVHFQCTIQICRHQCPEQCSDISLAQRPGETYEAPAVVGEPRYNFRKRRSLNETSEEKDIGVNRIIQVVSTRDLSFLIDKKEIFEEMKISQTESVTSKEGAPPGLICMSTSGFTATLVVLLAILIISCLLSAFLCLRYRITGDTQSIMSSYDNPLFLHRKGFFS